MKNQFTINNVTEDIHDKRIPETTSSDNGKFAKVKSDGTFEYDNIDISSKQDTLVSGTNIKTIGGNSILGSGDLEVGGGGIEYSEDGDKRPPSETFNEHKLFSTNEELLYDRKIFSSATLNENYGTLSLSFDGFQYNGTSIVCVNGKIYFGGVKKMYIYTIATNTFTYVDISSSIFTLTDQIAECLVAVGTDIYMIGGYWSRNIPHRELYKFDTLTNNVTYLKQLEDEHRYSVNVGNYIYMFTSGPLRLIERYNISDNTSTILDTPSFSRYGNNIQFAYAYGTDIYLGFKGTQDSYSGTLNNNYLYNVYFFKYDTIANKFTYMDVYRDVYWSGWAGLYGDIYFFGGQRTSSSTRVNSIKRFNILSKEISNVGITLSTANSHLVCKAYDGKIYLLGGTVTSEYNTVRELTITYSIERKPLQLYIDDLRTIRTKVNTNDQKVSANNSTITFNDGNGSTIDSFTTNAPSSKNITLNFARIYNHTIPITLRETGSITSITLLTTSSTALTSSTLITALQNGAYINTYVTDESGERGFNVYYIGDELRFTYQESQFSETISSIGTDTVVQM